MRDRLGRAGDGAVEPLGGEQQRAPDALLVA